MKRNYELVAGLLQILILYTIILQLASNGGLNARCFLSLSFTLFVIICRNVGAIVASYSRVQNLGLV